MYSTPTPTPSNFDYAGLLNRLDALTPTMINALSQRMEQKTLAGWLATSETTLSRAKNEGRALGADEQKRERQFLLIAACVLMGCMEPVERLLSSDPRRPVVILQLPEGTPGDADPLPELVDDTKAEGEFLTHFERGNHREARGAWRRMGAAWVSWGRDLDAAESRPDRTPLRRAYVPGLHDASGDGHGAALTPEPRVR